MCVAAQSQAIVGLAYLSIMAMAGPFEITIDRHQFDINIAAKNIPILGLAAPLSRNGLRRTQGTGRTKPTLDVVSVCRVHHCGITLLAPASNQREIPRTSLIVLVVMCAIVQRLGGVLDRIFF